jgi:uncharacterized protein YjbI with pentapeptide repeats
MAVNEKGCEAIDGGCFWAEFWKSYEPIADFIGHDAFRNGALVIAAIVTLFVAIWRARIADGDKDTAIKQAETSEFGLNIDRFHRGTEMLNSTSPFMSAAGARMLGGLARNNMKEYYPLVGRILSSYIEEVSPAPDFYDFSDQELEEATFLVPPEQCAAILIELSILNERRLSKCIFPFEVIKIRRTNLAKISLQGGNFSHATFSNSEMKRMLLTNFDLSFTNFYSCNLTGAILFNCNLTGAFLHNTDLKLAMLENTDLKNVDLSAAKNLTYAQLSLAKNVDPEFLSKLKAEEEAAAAKEPNEDSPT